MANPDIVQAYSGPLQHPATPVIHKAIGRLHKGSGVLVLNSGQLSDPNSSQIIRTPHWLHWILFRNMTATNQELRVERTPFPVEGSMAIFDDSLGPSRYYDFTRAPIKLPADINYQLVNTGWFFTIGWSS